MTTFEKAIRDPYVVWYGPYACSSCGKHIIRSGDGQSTDLGPITLDAQDHNHNYPNFQWQEHLCLGPSMQAIGGKARAAALPPEERSRIASNAAKKRWEKKVPKK